MDRFWIWYKLLDINYERKMKILFDVKDIKKIYNLSNEILKSKYDFTIKEINVFNDRSILNRAIEIDKYNKKRGIKVLNILDNTYPYLLRQIYESPILLYYLGDTSLLNKNCITIFQGLDIDEYGKNLIKYISKNIYKDNISIVSRMIKSDKYIYENNKNTIMVLSRGISDSFFLKTGIILSEYEYYVKNSKMNNVNRNRILSGLSREILIIQANIKDGAKYIVDLALEQGREIIVFPGDVFDNRNMFSNEMIKIGAKVITNYSELEVYEQIKNNQNM